MTPCPFCQASLSSEIPSEPILTVCTECLNPVYCDTPTAVGRAVPGYADVRAGAVEGSLGRELLLSLSKAMETLPPLPEVAQRVLKASRDPEVGVNDLAQLIGEDAVMASKVIRLANSPLYSGLTEIHDLRSACMRIGLHQVANAAQAVTFSGLFVSSKPQYRAVLQEFWRHAVASAYGAQAIARLTAAPEADALFLMGLLHDIGKLAMLTVTAKAADGPLARLKSHPDLFQEVLDAWHPLVGLHTVRHWRLPNLFGVVALCHEQPALTPNQNWLPAVHTVCLASLLAHACVHPDSEGEHGSLVNHLSARYLNLNDLKLAGLRVDLEDTLSNILAALAPSEEPRA